MLKSLAMRIGAVLHEDLAFEAAVVRASQRFERVDPEWNEVLFDEHILGAQTAPILARCLSGPICPDPDELARAWADQFRLSEKRKDELAQSAVPVAARFLLWLREEAPR